MKIIRCHFNQLTKAGKKRVQDSSFVENSGSVDIFQHDSVWQQLQLPQSLNHTVFGILLCVTEFLILVSLFPGLSGHRPGADEVVTGHKHPVFLHLVVYLLSS